ncbi:MAG: hypothetical protein WAS21_19810 [Geminicoccaceae bacterium]
MTGERGKQCRQLARAGVRRFRRELNLAVAEQSLQQGLSEAVVSELAPISAGMSQVDPEPAADVGPQCLKCPADLTEVMQRCKQEQN